MYYINYKRNQKWAKNGIFGLFLRVFEPKMIYCITINRFLPKCLSIFPIAVKKVPKYYICNKNVYFYNN